MKLTEKLNEELKSDILEGVFICDRVYYMMLDQNFIFREIMRFNIGSKEKQI